VADTAENGIAFGYPGASRGESAFPVRRHAKPVRWRHQEPSHPA
jgi:hypothetical protein